MLMALFALPASAAPFVLPGTVCVNYAVTRVGNDMVLTCPRYDWAPNAPVRRVWVTVRNWYGLCAYHQLQHRASGDTIVCLFPAKRPA